MQQLLTNVKDKDEPNDRQGAVYKIKCCDCRATYIGESGRNLNKRLAEHKLITESTSIPLNALPTVLTTTNDWL